MIYLIYFRFADNNSCDHFYTSAKTGEGLQEIFHNVCKKIVQQMSLNTNNNSSNKKKSLKITEEKNISDKTKSKGCC